ncbi:MAG: hypothetical protein U0414_11235 [Polyangiaceae bacterium]
MTEKVTLQGLHPKNTPAKLGPPPAALLGGVDAVAPSEPEETAAMPSPTPAPAAEESPPAPADAAPGPGEEDVEAPKEPAPEPKPRGASKKHLSVAQKAVIAERTDRILKSAKPGSAEYADACRDRAEAGLVVPAMKNTEMSLHAFAQFAQVTAADEAAAHRRAVRKSAFAVMIGLVVLSGALAIYLFIDRDSAKSGAASSASAAPSSAAKAADKPTAAAPSVASAPAPNAAESAVTPSATAAASTSTPPSNAPPIVRPSSAPPPKPSAVPAASAPKSTWDPAWK